MKNGKETFVKKIGSRWYAFQGDVKRNNVTGIGDDTDDWKGSYRWTDTGIAEVATPSSSRAEAEKKARSAGHYNEFEKDEY